MSDIAAAWYRAAALYPQAVIEAEEESLRDALEVAHELSNGPFSQSQLDALGNPYAKRDPRPPQDAAIINKQTGNFDAAWTINPPTYSGGEVASSLTNDSEHAHELDQGTSKMIARPTVDRIRETTEPRRSDRLNQAVASVLPGGSKNPL